MKDSTPTAATVQPVLPDSDACTKLNEARETADSTRDALLASGKVKAKQALLDSAFIGRKQLQCRGKDKMRYTVRPQNGGYTWQQFGVPPRPRTPSKP